MKTEPYVIVLFLLLLQAAVSNTPAKRALADAAKVDVAPTQDGVFGVSSDDNPQPDAYGAGIAKATTVKGRASVLSPDGVMHAAEDSHVQPDMHGDAIVTVDTLPMGIVAVDIKGTETS